MPAIVVKITAAISTNTKFTCTPGNAFVADCVLALAYTVMALGLNIIVGFAGLLDLGYVAFFAIGAHVAAWFGSAFWGIHVMLV